MARHKHEIDRQRHAERRLGWSLLTRIRHRPLLTLWMLALFCGCLAVGLEVRMRRSDH